MMDNASRSAARFSIIKASHSSFVSLLEQVTKEECEAFIIENLAADRLALSIIEPGRK